MTLSENEIVVRWMRTPEAGAPELLHWLEMLDNEEREQAGRFKLAPDRAAYVAAHALLRSTLSSIAGTAPASWRFAEDTLGRPQIEPANELRFSLSHCRRFVACAVCRGLEVGIDVEDLSRPEAQWRDALAFLPEAEHAYVDAVDGLERRNRFFRLWTMREAFAKASGVGMAKALEEIAFECDAFASTASIRFEAMSWRFEASILPEGLALAIAAPTDKLVIDIAKSDYRL